MSFCCLASSGTFAMLSFMSNDDDDDDQVQLVNLSLLSNLQLT